MKSCQLLDYLPEKRSEGRVKVKKAKKKKKNISKAEAFFNVKFY